MYTVRKTEKNKYAVVNPEGDVVREFYYEPRAQQIAKEYNERSEVIANENGN